MTKIKICGLTRAVDIDYVNAFKPDYIGFVFAKSKRQVTFETASTLKKQLDPEIKAVGVFVNEDPTFIITLCKAAVIDMIQLHGDETETYVKNIQRETGKPVIKAMRIKTSEDVMATEAEYALFDTYHKGVYGGTGETFNWHLVEGYKTPFFLAGGLDEHNVLEAIKACRPYAVDVSSGVETEGVKDKAKIEKLIHRIRREFKDEKR